ncbi:unnamed protein product [Echinostoma caproni]|uniref:ELM2 domain-containing protein n=1 Tax=Echinostoma caproni TaxID=27848 RepID=A0A183BEG5_9TREM|nr:unnamed protein product [Echinostoma caproni]
MSLEELLTLYGVPTSGLSIQIPSTQNNNRASRASRASHRRSTASTSHSDSATITGATENNVIGPVDMRDSRSLSPTVKRSRRSNASPSPVTPNATETVPDSDHSITKRKSVGPSTERTKDGGKDHPVTTAEVHESGRTSRRRAANAHGNAEKSGSQELNTAPTESCAPLLTTNATATAASSDESSRSVPATVSLDTPAAEQNPVSIESMPGSENPDVECEESRDSVREDSYSARFWQRAIGGGESPPSYNSDEDEDYAPSVESGHDWRGEIHVGDEYQASVPPFNAHPGELVDWWDTRRFEIESSLLWQPGKLPETDVVRFERLFAQTVMFPLPSERTVDDEEVSMHL